MSLWYVYAPNSMFVGPNHNVNQNDRVTLSSIDRLTVVQTGRLGLSNTISAPSPTARNLGTAQITSDTSFQQYRRASLINGARVTVTGTAQIIISDPAPVGRLVLSGRGG